MSCAVVPPNVPSPHVPVMPLVTDTHDDAPLAQRTIVFEPASQKSVAPEFDTAVIAHTNVFIVGPTQLLPSLHCCHDVPFQRYSKPMSFSLLSTYGAVPTSRMSIGSY